MNDILAISNLSKDKIQLLVKVARMYYEKNMIQSEIAKTLDVSRPYISRLLDEAKSWGIISTMIHDPLGEEYIFANKIKEYFWITPYYTFYYDSDILDLHYKVTSPNSLESNTSISDECVQKIIFNSNWRQWLIVGKSVLEEYGAAQHFLWENRKVVALVAMKNRVPC